MAPSKELVAAGDNALETINPEQVSILSQLPLRTNI